MNEKEDLTEEYARAAQACLRQEEVDYSHDAIYAAAILLDSYLRDDLTVEEALEEFIDNSGVKLGVRHG